ncbi:MAG: hypothetical protein GTO55_05960 [Armatimonadetes bacterium]|nr:hypothetical protein [Armatimonadota bacterium]NIM23799.1 hypothetical protein [Armatimonadota bacterium]NIM67676.1 hypothetical protein [Armatimonadota bacterium]NIN05877.1 hypothetical protein [Armatimonadota bacterium]NIO97246.1 hypothetical protein [Armatimonadota bacterium]
MASKKKQPTLTYDHLMEEIPKLAEAVNAFSTESVQLRAFDALIASLVGEAFSAPETSSKSGGRSDAAKKTSSRAKAKPRRTPQERTGSGRKAGRIPQEIDNLAVEGAPKSFPPMKEVKKNAERCMWVLEYVEQKKKISEMTAGSIAYIIHDRLKEKKILPETVNRALERVTSRHWVSPVTRGRTKYWRLLSAGRNHMQDLAKQGKSGNAA